MVKKRGLFLNNIFICPRFVIGADTVKSRGFWKEPSHIWERRWLFWFSSFLQTLEIKCKFENYPVTHLHCLNRDEWPKKECGAESFNPECLGEKNGCYQLPSHWEDSEVFPWYRKEAEKNSTLLTEIRPDVDRKQDRRFTVLLNKKVKRACLRITATQPGD